VRARSGAAGAVPEREPVTPQLLVITGLSGSGKTHVLRSLEDLGWFCVDNLPTALVPRFAELIRASPELRRSAVGLDVRERGFPRIFPRLLQELKRRLQARLLFVEADEKVLLRRFSETRRPHPLAVDEPAIEGIREERLALRPIRKLADQIIDTSDFTVHQLREYVRERYGLRERRVEFVVTVESFGYKYGVPLDADLVFDVRFLPNPNFVPSLKRLTGSHAPVVRYMRRQQETGAFLKRLRGFLLWMIPRYVREGKSYLTIGIGCTGGRHRSVMIANALARALKNRDYVVRVRHRDVKLQGSIA
jgi:UPF0042 nucleotide-binding protein